MEETRADRLRRARIAAGFGTASEAASRFGWSINTYKANENGNAPFSFKRAKAYATAFGVSPEWLYDGKPAEGLVPLIGTVGSTEDGSVQLQPWGGLRRSVPTPPGGSEKSVAVIVRGDAMRGYADRGSLIYFEDQFTRPKDDMFGEVVVVETDADEVLVRRLQRGSRPGLYNLESLAGHVMRDVRLRWAAHVTAIIPARVVNRIIPPLVLPRVEKAPSGEGGAE